MSHLRRIPKELVVQERCIYYAELESCPACSEPLQLSGHYDSRRVIQQLDRVIFVASRPKHCVDDQCSQHGHHWPSVRAQMVALPHSTYGLDVVAQAGWWHDRDHLNGDDIYRRLCPHIQIGRRTVDLLVHQYRLLLACAESQQPERLVQAVMEHGGLILHLDGLEPEGAREQLWIVRELFSERILIAGWLPRVNEPALTQFLTPVRDYLATQGWPVLATLSDKQGVLVNALKHVWPGALQHWCHSHYLRNAVDPLYDRDQAFKTDLRRDVRRVIRRSMSEVAAQARSGAYAPQMVTGLVLTEAPSAPNVPMSTKADTEATVSALPDTPTAHPVIRGYAQVLQHTLARDGRAPWFLAGLTLYADLQAIAESMARCLAKRPDPRLQLWHAALAANLERHAPDSDTIRRGQTWVEAIRRVLDEIPLPTPDAPGPGGDAAARNLAFALGRIADESVTDPWLIEFRQHLLALSERYWPGLFPCYDIVGLPRTNNDLEGLYGQTKRNARRLSGLRQVRQPLQRHGAWLVYRSQDESATALHARLAQVSAEAYQAERTRWLARQEQFRQRHRWRHQRANVLSELEAAWGIAPPDSS